jgi:Protein of unknown function (DUF1326)
MARLLTLTVLALVATTAPAAAAGITGQYVEARTCDVWTGPCFANADFNLTGKNAVMAWRVDKGSVDNVSLDGLGVVAVISASDTLGLEQTGPGRAVLIVDSRASAAQREALVRLARRQGGKLLQNVVAVQSASIDLNTCHCKGEACAELQAGAVRLKTRCLDAAHDKACGNESAFYPPLALGVQVQPAAAVENSFGGTGLPETWRDFDRRGAYVGSFAVR